MKISKQQQKELEWYAQYWNAFKRRFLPFDVFLYGIPVLLFIFYLQSGRLFNVIVLFLYIMAYISKTILERDEV